MRYVTPQVHSNFRIGVIPFMAQYEQAVLLFTPQNCPGEPSRTLVIPEIAPVCFFPDETPVPGSLLNTYTCLEDPGTTYEIFIVDAVPGTGSECSGSGDVVYETTLRFEPNTLPICTVTSFVENLHGQNDSCVD